MNGKREMIKELTNSAWSILSKYENDEQNGLLTREEAQRTAISRIQYLRYGDENKDYFWITDMHPVMVIHPYRPDLNNKDLSNFSDPHGKKLFVEFVETVRKSEHGYVDYMWQWKDDSLHIVPKLSYVKIFKSWGWVIGTGIYIEDVKKEITALTRKLIWISIGISLIIALLLFFISQQSFNAEKKRLEAENELHESKEKYKTLVEASTEGLLMLSDGKISFLNNAICKMIGYDYFELVNLAFFEILSETNSKNIFDNFSQNIVEEGQYNINLKKKNGGFIEVLATSSSAAFNNKEVSILIIKDITADRNSNLSVLDYQKLLSTMNVGFFRASLNYKGRFIFANETAIKILGYNNFNQLSENHIIKLLANTADRKNIRKILLEKGVVKNEILKIQKRKNETAFVSITLVLYSNADSKDFICDGIIEDVTIQENAKVETNKLITELKTNTFLIEQPVKDFLSKVNSLDSGSTIEDAVKLLSKRKADNLLITKNDRDYIGIVTNTDIQQRVISLNLHKENPVYLIMSSPIIYINENTSIVDAIDVCERRKVNHLIVKNDSDIIMGVFKVNNIYMIIKNSLSFYTKNIEKSDSIEELKQNYKSLQLLIKPLINSELSVKYITRITSSFSDSLICRLIDLTIEEIGKSPVGFSFICLGSEGRKEETLFTDQDNAIIYEDVSLEKESLVRNYFNKLGGRVCDSLNEIGYSFCKGNIMAKNPQWCQPYTIWENYFTNWIFAPEPQNLLDATIFFDFRNVYGDDNLTQRLRKTIDNLINERPLFSYHLAYNTFNLKAQQISPGNILSDKNSEIIELKSALIIIVMLARTYSFQHNIGNTNTIERLEAIKAKQIINGNAVDEIIFAYNYLMKQRFRNQIYLSDNNLPLSNLLDSNRLIEIERTILKKVLSLIPSYQYIIGIDFRITS